MRQMSRRLKGSAPDPVPDEVAKTVAERIVASDLFKHEKTSLAAKVVILNTSYRPLPGECVVSLRFHEVQADHTPFWREFAVKADGTVLCADIEDTLGGHCDSTPD